MLRITDRIKNILPLIERLHLCADAPSGAATTHPGVSIGQLDDRQGIVYVHSLNLREKFGPSVDMFRTLVGFNNLDVCAHPYPHRTKNREFI